MKLLDCQFGPKYYKQKPIQGKRLWLQSTRKIGCNAHVEVKAFTLYPEFARREGEPVQMEAQVPARGKNQDDKERN